MSTKTLLEMRCPVINSRSNPVQSGVSTRFNPGTSTFILYINSLPSTVFFPMKIFADDVAIYCSVQSPIDCRAFQHDLDLVFTGCSKWQMHINPLSVSLIYITKNTFQSNLLTELITFSGFYLLSILVLWWILSYPGMIIFS